MSILTTIANGAAGKDVRDTINNLLATVAPAVLATTLQALGTDNRFTARPITTPPAWLAQWTATGWLPTGVTVNDDRLAPYASLAQTAKAIFDSYSAARSAPTNTYYVSTAGSDSNAGNSGSNAFASIAKAISTANATSAPATIVVGAGTYPRSTGFAGTTPTVDTAFIANGRVVSSVHDATNSLVADTTYTSTYSWTVANVNKVVDLLTLDRFGLYVELTYVATPTLCNSRPGTWNYTNGVLYINRGDGAAPTVANTRVYRASVNNGSVTSSVNVWFGGLSSGDGFDFEGGQYGALISALSAAPSAQKALIASSCTFRYGGGYGLLSNSKDGQAPMAMSVSSVQQANGVALNSFSGVSLFFDCDASGNFADGFNCHNSNYTNSTATTGGSFCNWGTINCTGFNNGHAPAQSCNGWTQHDNCVGFDLCGIYENNHGGTMRPINNSYSWWVNSQPRFDLGDLAQGGAIPPTAIVCDSGAPQAWLDNVNPIMPAGQTLIRVASTAAIYLRNMAPQRSVIRGTGTVGTY